MAEILSLANVLQMDPRERDLYLKGLTSGQVEEAADSWHEVFSDLMDDLIAQEPDDAALEDDDEIDEEIDD